MIPESGHQATYAWDASALHHAVLIDRADVLLELADHGPNGRCRHVTTAAIVQELASYGLSLPDAVEVVNVDGLTELFALATWVQRVSSAVHNRGEATIFAWAEVHGAEVVIDDREAVRIGRAAGLRAHGSLWVMAEAVRSGYTTASSAANLVDQLIAAGARYPHGIGGFAQWAKSAGLLP